MQLFIKKKYFRMLALYSNYYDKVYILYWLLLSYDIALTIQFISNFISNQ